MPSGAQPSLMSALGTGKLGRGLAVQRSVWDQRSQLRIDRYACARATVTNRGERACRSRAMKAPLGVLTDTPALALRSPTVANVHGDLAFEVLLDERSCETHSTYCWAGGGMVLTIRSE